MNDYNLNRIIPYRMLLNATSATNTLVKQIIPEKGIPSLRFGLQKLDLVLKSSIRKAKEGFPIVGYHFSFPAEFLQCFE